MRLSRPLVLLAFAALAACGGDEPVVDAMPDAVNDAPADAPADAPIDAPADAPIDAPAIDAAIDAPAIDAAIDALIDAAIDAPAIDATIDAPAIDAPIDAPAIDAPVIDAAIDAPTIDAAIDAPSIDAAVDAPPFVFPGVPLPCDRDWPEHWPAPPPAPALPPSADLSLSQPTIAVGPGLAPVAVTITNAGAAPVGPLAFDVGPGLTVTTPARAALASGATATVTIQPDRAPASRRSRVRVHAPGQHPLDLEVVFPPAPPAAAGTRLELTAPGFLFRDGASSTSDSPPRVVLPIGEPTSIVVTNPRDDAVTITSLQLSGAPGTVDGTACVGVLGPGATCTAVVTAGTASSATLAAYAVPTEASGTLDLLADTFRTHDVVLTAGRARTLDDLIDCPGRCTARWPSQSDYALFVDPPPDLVPVTATSCTATHCTHTVSYEPATANHWEAVIATVTAVRLLDSGRVVAIGAGEWNTSAGAPWVRVFDRGVEIARRDHADQQLLGVERFPGGGFLLAGATGGVGWVERLDDDATVLWHADLDAPGAPLLSVSPGGLAYVRTPAVDHTHLSVLSPGGALLWTHELTGPGWFFVDGLGFGFGYFPPGPAFTTAGTMRRWAPHGGRYPDVTLPPNLDCHVAGMRGFQALGDGRVVENRYRAVFTTASCLGLRAYRPTGALDAAGGATYSADGVPQCGWFGARTNTVLGADPSHEIFYTFNASLQLVGARQRDRSRMPNRGFDFGPAHHFVVAESRRIVVFPP